MERSRIRNAIIAIVVIGAIACIAAGINKVWESFKEYDEAILEEKDSQFYSLIRSDDINLENSIDAFVREAEMFFGRQKLTELREEWSKEGGSNGSAIRAYFRESSLQNNPIYADIVMFSKSKPVLSASGRKDYSFLADVDSEGLRFCGDSDGNYYMAYENNASESVSFVALIDLKKLYIATLGENSTRDMILVDRDSKLIMYKPEGRPAEDVSIMAAGENGTPNMVSCRDFMLQCQKTQTLGGRSLELTGPDGTAYTARIVVIPSDSTVNGEFAIGVTADYDHAIEPSRQAAAEILVGGAIAVAGIIALITIMLYLGRVNSANATELNILKKRNSAMEELNQNMLALSHHQRLETIGTMTASIAHDFNNLLTPIMGYSMMSMEMLNEDQTDIQENLMEVYNASVKAKDMVTRLADLSKKGKEESYIVLDPSEVIRNALKVTLPAKPKNVEVRGSFHTGRARMRGDSTQISQLVINIVLNAYDAMREKGGTLFASAGLEDGRIVMKFKDTGSGMDAETIARIFDPFYTTKESGKGTGLGLAIVAQIAETHGGKVYVDSTPGEGTEFRITFPVIERETTTDLTKTINISPQEMRRMAEEAAKESTEAAKDSSEAEDSKE